MSEVVDKIRKLLALAQDKSNEHESDQALRLATALMMKHGIDQSQVESTGPRLDFTDPFHADKRWHTFVGIGASKLYGVRYITVGRTGLAQFAGRVENCEAAVETHQFIVEQIERLYKQSLPKGLPKNARAEYRRTFKEACALRVVRRIEAIIRDIETNDDADTGSRALVVVDHRKNLEQEADDFLSGKDVTSKERSLTLRVTPGAVAGYVMGDHVQVNRQVGG